MSSLRLRSPWRDPVSAVSRGTELDLDLTPDMFSMPPQMTWTPEMVHKVISEDGDADFRVLWNVDEY